VVGVLAGGLGGLVGVGGGIILVPGLIWAAGLDRHTATGTSLLAILPIAVVGALTYALAPGGVFDPAASALLTAGSLGGAILGARTNAVLSERALRIGFAVLSAIMGVRLVVPLGLGAGSDELALHAGTIVELVALGLAGGFLSGLMGVGGSAIVIAIMVLTLDTSQAFSQGIALAAVIPTVIVGSVVHHELGSLAPRIGLTAGLIGAVGAIPGALAALALPSEALRTTFGVFLLVSAARMLLAERARRKAARRRCHSRPPTVVKGVETMHEERMSDER
jgi:uncharacterized membrane protein YfcA